MNIYMYYVMTNDSVHAHIHLYINIVFLKRAIVNAQGRRTENMAFYSIP